MTAFRFFAPSLACVLISSLFATHAQDLSPGPIPEVSKNPIEFNSAAEALAALRQRKDVQISTVRGWTIIADRSNLTLWSFAPKTDPAYPSAVKRVFRPHPGGGSDIDMSILCDASKEACDNLVREFAELNNQLPH